MQEATLLCKVEQTKLENRIRIAILIAIVLGTLIIDWSELVTTFARAIIDPQYTHILLVLPGFGLMIGMQWAQLKSAFSYSMAQGIPIIAAAAVLGILAADAPFSIAPEYRHVVGMFALVLSWLGATALCLGVRTVRRCIFPLLFLFILVPMPEKIMNVLVISLQVGSAFAANIMFSASGVPVVRDGALLVIPGLTINVAPECSSIRSSLILIVTTAIIAQILLCTLWKKILLICISVPISIAKNGLRIYTISMLGTKIDPGYLNGILHHKGGPVFLAIALLVMAVILWTITKGEYLIMQIRKKQQ